MAQVADTVNNNAPAVITPHQGPNPAYHAGPNLGAQGTHDLTEISEPRKVASIAEHIASLGFDRQPARQWVRR